jgi:hypothetical protein
LKQLVRTAAALPGRKLQIALWHRLEPWITEAREGVTGPAEPGELPASTRTEVARLRALVATCLGHLAARLEATLAPALGRARKNWETVDHLVVIDAPLGAALKAARRELQAAAKAEDRAAAAVALEGLLTLEAATGLTALTERRLSSLIRLRVRSKDHDLLPGGRPFLDLGAALAEAAHAWA